MGDARGWSCEEYKASVLEERSVQSRIIYGLQFAPTRDLQYLATAASDGIVALHSISQSPSIVRTEESLEDLAKPLWSNRTHEGPAYGLLSFGELGHEMLASCGDDGRVVVWRWEDILDGAEIIAPILQLQIPQQSGQFGALLPASEVNALAVDIGAGQLFCAAGDGRAYAWDLATGHPSMVFRGHADYLHCIASRSSHKQIITGSEDGTARIWDCRSGRCTAFLDPWNATRVLSKPKDERPWVSCLSVDASENWMVCGSGGGCLTLWNLPILVCATRIATSGRPQAVTFTKDEIVMVGTQPHISRFSFGGKLLSQAACAPPSSHCVAVHSSGVTAVGGHAGMVDVMSTFGSHLCVLCPHKSLRNLGEGCTLFLCLVVEEGFHDSSYGSRQ